MRTYVCIHDGTDTAWCFQGPWTLQVSLENPELLYKKQNSLRIQESLQQMFAGRRKPIEALRP